MKIDRKRAAEAFQHYVCQYDMTKEMIRLKAEHTYRVSELCDSIACSIRLPEDEVDLAWLIGLLHDIGRFEQQKKYGTFIDADSIDHAGYGEQLLFEGSPALIREFVKDAAEDEVIRIAVGEHSAYRIPEGLDKRTAAFCHIVRDADKIDILRVNTEFPLEEIYNATTEKLYNAQVTPEVMQSFDEGHTVLSSLKKEAVDYIVGQIALAYEIVYPISLELVRKQGSLEKLMAFQSENPITRKQFAHIRERMGRYLAGNPIANKNVSVYNSNRK